MMTTYRLLCSIKTKSIAEPTRAALLGEIQIMTYKNCLLEKPETKRPRVPGQKKQKKTLRIWLGGGDGAAWVDHAPPGGRVDGASGSVTRPQPMAPPATDAASSLVGHRGNVPSALWHAPGLLALQRLGFDDPRVSPPPPVLTFDTANLETRATPPGVAVWRV